MAAIAAEAQAITAKRSGDAAEALEALARAYALVVSVAGLNDVPVQITSRFADRFGAFGAVKA